MSERNQTASRDSSTENPVSGSNAEGPTPVDRLTDLAKELRRDTENLTDEAKAEIQDEYESQGHNQMLNDIVRYDAFYTKSKQGHMPKRLTARHRLIAHLTALGVPNDEIALQVNKDISYISRVVNMPLMQAEIDHNFEKYFSPKTIQEKLAKIAERGVKVIEKVVDDDNEKMALRVDTVFRLLDRELGKPRQQIDVNNTMFSQFLEILNSARNDQTIKVIANNVVIPPESDTRKSIDTWISQAKGELPNEETEVPEVPEQTE